MIPEHTDLQNSAKQLADFLMRLNPQIKVRINAFHNHGVHGIAKTWPTATQQQIESFAAELKHYGLQNIILPSVYL